MATQATQLNTEARDFLSLATDITACISELNLLFEAQVKAVMFNDLVRLASLTKQIRHQAKLLQCLESERLAFWEERFAKPLNWQEAGEALKSGWSIEQARHWQQVYPLLRAGLKQFVARQSRSKALLEQGLTWVQNSVQQVYQQPEALEAQAYSADLRKRT